MAENRLFSSIGGEWRKTPRYISKEEDEEREGLSFQSRKTDLK